MYMYVCTCIYIEIMYIHVATVYLQVVLLCVLSYNLLNYYKIYPTPHTFSTRGTGVYNS